MWRVYIDLLHLSSFLVYVPYAFYKMPVMVPADRAETFVIMGLSAAVILKFNQTLYDLLEKWGLWK
ncbi:hypothetical protein IMZ31_21900 (plasmid) [Pontibacillus sp. ALD_SL1]|uniref:hypothetical protein n=1 Tax=Pontibacillus sp. ALD_SL1 TaxID=2777185 RepID=UPI001A9593C6|nr:hypothetical protein [Pontibacillus sp. ALD_SL1]QST02107.1 hypothetical protein IMZ31_21900 [Pontibacillus sp. ALD_SL1]